MPCELEETKITESHSRIITTAVVKAAKEAGGAGLWCLCGVLFIGE